MEGDLFGDRDGTKLGWLVIDLVGTIDGFLDG